MSNIVNRLKELLLLNQVISTPMTPTLLVKEIPKEQLEHQLSVSVFGNVNYYSLSKKKYIHNIY